LTLFRLPAQRHSQNFTVKDIEFGQGIKVTEGSNLTIVATGPQLSSAMAARDTLADIGWDTEILYIHTIRPLDKELIRSSVSKTRHVLVVEEHMQSGGLGDDVLRAVWDIPNVRYSSLAIPDIFISEYGTYGDHCERLGLTPYGILNKVKADFGVPPGKRVQAE
jgi:transketolase